MDVREVLDLKELAGDHRQKARNLRRLATLGLLTIVAVGVMYAIPLAELRTRQVELQAEMKATDERQRSERGRIETVEKVVNILGTYRGRLSDAAERMAANAAAEAAACSWALGVLWGRAERKRDDGVRRMRDDQLPTSEKVLSSARAHAEILGRHGLPIRASAGPVRVARLQYPPGADVPRTEPAVEPEVDEDERAYPSDGLKRMVLDIGGVEADEFVRALLHEREAVEGLRKSFLIRLMERAKTSLTERARSERADARRRLDGLSREWRDLVGAGVVEGEGIDIEVPSEKAIIEPPPDAEPILSEIARSVEMKHTILRASAAVLGSSAMKQGEILRAKAAELDASLRELRNLSDRIRAETDDLDAEVERLEKALTETAAALESQILPIRVFTADSHDLPAQIPMLAAGLLFYLWLTSRRLDRERDRLGRHLEGASEADRDMLFGRALLATFRWPLLLTGLFVVWLLLRAVRMPGSTAGTLQIVVTTVLLLPLIPGVDRLIRLGKV
jgi:hypothetical protein